MSPPMQAAAVSVVQNGMTQEKRPPLRVVQYAPATERPMDRTLSLTKRLTDSLVNKLERGDVGWAIASVEEHHGLVPILIAKLSDSDPAIERNAKLTVQLLCDRADHEMRPVLRISLGRFKESLWMRRLSMENSGKHEEVLRDIQGMVDRLDAWMQ
jgi:hypothetical protein